MVVFQPAMRGKAWMAWMLDRKISSSWKNRKKSTGFHWKIHVEIFQTSFWSVGNLPEIWLQIRWYIEVMFWNVGMGQELRRAQRWCCLKRFGKNVCFLTMQRVSFFFIFWMNRAVAVYMIHYLHDLPEYGGFGQMFFFPSWSDRGYLF